ncbi:MAG: hypothetical protein EOP49_10225 [Sphingobacteriales bacterium]|nr:MAG: hypothetical protein EOP49_10225 [Sphingobacteriales bacterium]
MKKFLLALLLVATYSEMQAQKPPVYAPIGNVSEAEKNAKLNEIAAQAAAYLLAVPTDTTKEDVKDAIGFLVTWMSETPDYTFEVGPAAMKLSGENTTLMPVFLAAMVEYQIKNPQFKDDREKVMLHASRRLIAYAQEPSHKAKMPDQLKKAAAADKKGELNKFVSALNEE